MRSLEYRFRFLAHKTPAHLVALIHVLNLFFEKQTLLNFFDIRSQFIPFFVYIANVEAPVTMDCDVIQRGGKDYVQVKSVHLHLKVSHFSMDFKSKSIHPTINNIANKVINANWKLLKAEIDSDLEKYIGDVIKSIIVPITDKISIQDLLK